MNRNPEIHQKERKCEERFGKDGQQTDADGRRTTHDPRGHNPPHATSTNLQQRFLSHTNTDSDTLRHTETPAFTFILSLKIFHPQVPIQYRTNSVSFIG